MEFSQEYLQVQNIDKFINYLRELELINNYLNSVEFTKIYNELKRKLVNLIQFLEGLKTKFSGCIEGFLKLSQEGN
jgi:16S rRNA G527 N7-methylase RsmG